MPVVISGTDNFVLNADSLGTAAAGAFDYDGKVFYATPQGTQRGVVPGAQFFRLDSALAGANVNTAQNVLGVGVTLSSSTVYAFEALYIFSKTTGGTNHNFQVGFGGTATINNILLMGSILDIGGAATIPQLDTAPATFTNNAVTALTVISVTTTNVVMGVTVRGTVSINAGGTFIPQYTLSAAPGGAYSTAAGSYFLIYPIGASGANVNVGTWA
jgi:hypothetical protein